MMRDKDVSLMVIQSLFKAIFSPSGVSDILICHKEVAEGVLAVDRMRNEDVEVRCMKPRKGMGVKVKDWVLPWSRRMERMDVGKTTAGSYIREK